MSSKSEKPWPGTFCAFSFLSPLSTQKKREKKQVSLCWELRKMKQKGCWRRFVYVSRWGIFCTILLWSYQGKYLLWFLLIPFFLVLFFQILTRTSCNSRLLLQPWLTFKFFSKTLKAFLKGRQTEWIDQTSRTHFFFSCTYFSCSFCSPTSCFIGTRDNEELTHSWQQLHAFSTKSLSPTSARNSRDSRKLRFDRNL